jgi:hypothetical protein
MRFATIARLGLGLCLVALAITACASSSGRHGSARAALVSVREKDFRILLKPARVPAGRVDLRVDDVGPADHELILIRAIHGPLPLRHDGLTVNEEALKRVTIGLLEPATPGTIRHLRATLPKGKYEVFCNMAGHYLGGMHAFLVVT